MLSHQLYISMGGYCHTSQRGTPIQEVSPRRRTEFPSRRSPRGTNSPQAGAEGDFGNNNVSPNDQSLDKSCPCLTTNIHNSSGYAGGTAQIQHMSAINGKSCPNSTTTIHDSSGYAGGATQIPHVNSINVNAINGKSCFVHKHPRFFRLCRRHCPNYTCEHN